MMKGSCHCGDVKFEVNAALEGPVVECNCSHCRRKGFLLWFVPRDKLRHATPEHHIATYTFNKHAIQHHFCLRCGVQPFGEGKDPQGNPMAAINVRCIDEVDLATVARMPYDGANA